MEGGAEMETITMQIICPKWEKEAPETHIQTAEHVDALGVDSFRQKIGKGAGGGLPLA